MFYWNVIYQDLSFCTNAGKVLLLVKDAKDCRLLQVPWRTCQRLNTDINPTKGPIFPSPHVGLLRKEVTKALNWQKRWSKSMGRQNKAHKYQACENLLVACASAGFGWDRVSFQKKAWGDTAGLADPNWPNKQCIWYHMPSCSVPRGGPARGEVNHGSGACWALGGESATLCVPLTFCIFFLSVLLFLLFVSFAVPLNCPYSDPWVLLFSSHSPPHPTREGGAIEQPCGSLLLARAKPQQCYTPLFWGSVLFTSLLLFYVMICTRNIKINLLIDHSFHSWQLVFSQ